MERVRDTEFPIPSLRVAFASVKIGWVKPKSGRTVIWRSITLESPAWITLGVAVNPDTKTSAVTFVAALNKVREATIAVATAPPMGVEG